MHPGHDDGLGIRLEVHDGDDLGRSGGVLVCPAGNPRGLRRDRWRRRRRRRGRQRQWRRWRGGWRRKRGGGRRRRAVSKVKFDVVGPGGLGLRIGFGRFDCSITDINQRLSNGLRRRRCIELGLNTRPRLGRSITDINERLSNGLRRRRCIELGLDTRPRLGRSITGVNRWHVIGHGVGGRLGLGCPEGVSVDVHRRVVIELGLGRDGRAIVVCFFRRCARSRRVPGGAGRRCDVVCRGETLDLEDRSRRHLPGRWRGRRRWGRRRRRWRRRRGWRTGFERRQAPATRDAELGPVWVLRLTVWTDHQSPSGPSCATATPDWPVD